MVEVYVSAWTSGAYDAAIAQHSMSFALALHHIFGYIFVQGNIVKEKLAVDKVIRTLVRSSTRKSQQQVIICWENVKRLFSVPLVLFASFCRRRLLL
jgi:hypothetical protein